MVSKKIEEAFNKLSRPRLEILLTELRENREHFAPAVLRLLKKVAKHPKNYIKDEEYSAHLVAMYFLAEIRYEPALPWILKLHNHPDEDVRDVLLGDTITETLPPVIASLSKGHIEQLRPHILNAKVENFIRSGYIHSVLISFTEGEISEEKFIKFIKKLFNHHLVFTNEIVLSEMVRLCCQCCPWLFQQEIASAFENHQVDLSYFGPEFFTEALEKGRDQLRAEWEDARHNHLCDDAIKFTYWFSDIF